MDQDKHWGGSWELCIAAEMLQCTFYLLPNVANPVAAPLHYRGAGEAPRVYLWRSQKQSHYWAAEPLLHWEQPKEWSPAAFKRRVPGLAKQQQRQQPQVPVAVVDEVEGVVEPVEEPDEIVEVSAGYLNDLVMK